MTFHVQNGDLRRYKKDFKGLMKAVLDENHDTAL